MARPELPYLAAGGIAVVGATVRDGKLPDVTLPAIGLVVIILVTSATGETPVAPLVNALGLLVLMATVFGTTRVLLDKKRIKGNG